MIKKNIIERNNLKKQIKKKKPGCDWGKDQGPLYTRTEFGFNTRKTSMAQTGPVVTVCGRRLATTATTLQLRRSNLPIREDEAGRQWKLCACLL